MSARIPPNEAALLGASLVDPSAYWRIADLIRPEHFTTSECAAIWRTIVRLAAAGDAFDAVTVGETCGPLATELAANSSYSRANVRAYADRVVDAYLARTVDNAGRRISTLDGTGAERLAAAQRIVRDISAGAAPVRTARDVLQGVVARMQQQCDTGGEMAGLSTGLGHLDRMTSGLQPGDLVIVGGRPSMGKSVLASQFSMHAALNGKGAHVASLEMSAEDWLSRMIAADGRVDFQLVRHARDLGVEEWPRVHEASARLSNSPLTIDDQAFALDAICARIRQQAMATGLSIAVVDYLTYIDLPKGERQDLRVQECTRTLKRLAKELQIPLVLVCQLNRDVESRTNKRPTLGDLRDAGAIEQDADLILFLYRDDYYEPKHHTAGFAELIVAKQRNGKTGTLPLKHDFSHMRFDEAEGLPSAAPEDPDRPGRGFASRYGKARGAADSEARIGA